MDKQNKITFLSWCQDLEYNLKCFKDWWLGKNLLDKDNYPLELRSGDFDEQFSLFCEQRKNDPLRGGEDYTSE